MTICFTGKRPKDLYGYKNDSINEYKKLRTLLTNYLANIIENNDEEIFKFITGGAQGVDQLAFWAVEHLKKLYPNENIVNYVYLPDNNYGENWSEKGLFSKEQFKQIKDKADCINIVTNNNDVASLFTLFKRNESMINDSDIIIAVYTSATANKGGTAHAIKYAKRKNKTVYEINIDTMNIDYDEKTKR